MRLHLIEFFPRCVCSRKAKSRIERIVLPIESGIGKKRIIKMRIAIANTGNKRKVGKRDAAKYSNYAFCGAKLS